MRERIDIVVPEAKLELNSAKRERLARTYRRETTDRVPVVVEPQLLACLHGRGARFGEMSAGPRNHLRGLILNHKWRIENVPDDLPIETECLTLEQDLGALRGAEFPMQIVFQEDDPPKTTHLLHEPEEIDRLAGPDPAGGYNRTRVEWFRAMAEMEGDFDVRLNGAPLPVHVTITHPGGPIPSAFALCGSNLFLWMATDPDRVTRLMGIVTESHLRCIAYIDAVSGADPHHPVSLGADAAELISPAAFREFVVPYYRRIWDAYPGPRDLHMCGKIDHLLEILRDDLQIDALNGFGFPTSRRRLGQTLAGRVLMRGGPHPLLIHDGPVDRILDECNDYITTVGARGGYILSDGFGLMPGTPPEHILAMIEASRRAGWTGSEEEREGSQ